jgi:hypothetical protein
MSVVNVREALIAWCRRRGYHETGEIIPFPYGKDRFDTPKWDNLSSLVLEKVLDQTTANEIVQTVTDA